MLSHSKKINTQLFKEILNKGKVRHFDYFSVKFLKSPLKEESKFTFVISKKVEKKAVLRNKLKRKAFNIINNNYKNLPSSINIIFFFKKEVKKLKFEVLKKEILKTFEII